MSRPILRMFLLLVIFLFASASEPDEGKHPLIDTGEFDCLPVSTFGLKGLRLWNPEGSIRSLLGKPKSVAVGWDEDDGGRYEVRTFHYDDIEVDAARGDIYRIYTDSRNVSTPSGIQIGDNMEEVIRILGRIPRSWTPAESEFYIVTCPVNDVWVYEDYVTFEFDSDKVLISIVYEVNIP